MTSFSDAPLELPVEAPTLHDTFEAKYVTQYFENYIDSHIYNGSSLRDRIQFHAKVLSVQKIAGGWELQIDEGSAVKTLQCTRLAVASGLTSLPQMPDFPRSQDWAIPVLHHRDFGISSKDILGTPTTYQNITVLGGGKSAADMVYASVKAGKNVNWIIRTTGEGPGIFMNPAASGRYRNNVEAGATQRATIFTPSSFHPMIWWAKLLHQLWQFTWGKTILERKLFAADVRYKAWANYRAREGALPGFRELEPSAS
jgi:hypothetical protein